MKSSEVISELFLRLVEYRERMKIGAFVLAASTVILLGAGVYSIVAVIPRALAQSSTDTTTSTGSNLTDAQRAALQAQYDELQQEIAQYQAVITQTKAQEASLTGDVTELNAQIAKAQAEINQRTLTIDTLTQQIDQKSSDLTSLQNELQQGNDSLAKILREQNEEETTPLVVLMLADGSLSNYLSDIDNISSVNVALQDLFDQLQGIQTQTEAQKEQLASQQNEQLNAQHDVEVQKQAIAVSQQTKQQELDTTKGQESAYDQVLAQKQAEATQIRDALFNLRDTQGISFGTALQYAQTAEQKTGVDASFILAILRQESDLGQNVGQCLLVNTTTGAGKGKNTGTPIANVMNPTRDVPPFLAITSALGIDPYSQVVSCPQSVGYGGAMGPSQFIPSTWTLYENRIASATGDSVADPWDAQDAVMATALYMADLGADAGTYSAERKAAAEYYAGSNWAVYGISYANSVLSYADQYQQQIACLNDVTQCGLSSSN